MKRPAVFFDRDNTLIVSDGYLGDPERVELVDGAAEAVARVRGLGFAAVVFSNQSGVARGLFGEDAVYAVNHRLDELLHEDNPAATIDRHEFCPYHPDAPVERYRQDSELRKPNPGMIHQAARTLDLDLTRSWAVGDAPRDIEAGKAAGLRTILLRIPGLPLSAATQAPLTAAPDFTAASLEEAIDVIQRNRFAAAEPAAEQVAAENAGAGRYGADAAAVAAAVTAGEIDGPAGPTDLGTEPSPQSSRPHAKSPFGESEAEEDSPPVPANGHPEVTADSPADAAEAAREAMAEEGGRPPERHGGTEFDAQAEQPAAATRAEKMPHREAEPAVASTGPSDAATHPATEDHSPTDENLQALTWGERMRLARAHGILPPRSNGEHAAPAQPPPPPEPVPDETPDVFEATPVESPPPAEPEVTRSVLPTHALAITSAPVPPAEPAVATMEDADDPLLPPAPKPPRKRLAGRRGEESADAPLTGRDLARLEELAVQILQELRRSHEQDAGDFSISKALAGVFQVATLYMGVYACVKWSSGAEVIPILLAAIALQTFTISLYIMNRPR